MQTRRFEHVAKNRFWEVCWEGSEVETSSGAIGSNGRSARLSLGTAREADRHVDAELAKKLAAGYREVLPESVQVQNTPRVAAAPDWIARIAAAFDDDAPRMVYADWLLAAGDPLGELIAVQCELGRLPPGDARQRPLRAREENLFTNFRRRWIPTVDCRCDFTFARGFIERALIEPPFTHAALAQLVAGAPLLRTLDIAERYGEQPWWETLKLPSLRQITGLSMRAMWLVVKDVVALLAAEDLVNVDRLGLRNCHLGHDHLEALVRPWRALDLHQNNLGANGVSLVLERLDPTRLEALDVGSSLITDAGARAIAETPLPRLQTLALRRSQLTPDGMRGLLGAPNLARLATLDLSCNRIGGAELFVMTNLPSLTSLDLRETELDDAGLLSLLRAPLARQLRVLDLSENALTAAGARALIDWYARAELPSLVSLNVSGNELGGLARAIKSALPAVRVTARRTGANEPDGA